MRACAALLLTLALSARVSATPPRWHELETRAYGAAEYAADFSRRYADAAEEALRSSLVTKRLAAIRAHNAGDAPYKMVRLIAGSRAKLVARVASC